MGVLTQNDLAPLLDGCGYIEFSDRTIVELEGADAQSFLQRFCTNDIERLQPGEGCEAFLTSVRGKTLGHLLVSVEASSVVLETVAAQANTIITHLDRYVFNDRVALVERSADWRQWLLVGAGWNGRLPVAGKSLPVGTGHWILADVEGVEVRLISAPYAIETCFILRAECAAADAVAAALGALEATPCNPLGFQWQRIAAGFPWFGRDFDQGNLPQELDRNEAAISFTKGCYLGQETVARLDALGHVNRLLRGLLIEQPQGVEEGCPLQLADREVGRLTSLIEGEHCGIGLAIIRQDAAQPGTKLDVSGRRAIVRSLPMQAMP